MIRIFFSFFFFFFFFSPVLVWCNRTEVVPFFHGHVFENSAPGSRVNGLNVPLRRLDPQQLCTGTRAGGGGGGDTGTAHFRLTGDGSENFRVFAHHRRGHILLKTSGVLDREERAGYSLGLQLCCGMCEQDSRVASIRVDVLDTNDHPPWFPPGFSSGTGSGSPPGVRLSLAGTTALRSAVLRVSARDRDSGKNAEIFYFTQPRNGSFYAVPKTGDILLVDSILGLEEPIRFQVFARDRGWPPRTSSGLQVEVRPRHWTGTTGTTGTGSTKTRKSRSVLETTDSPVFINVSEDAGIGSVVMNLNPVRFQSATFELVEPEPENSPVTVSRDNGDMVISRRLDRETEPLVEISVRVQDKRGEIL